jgi:hypothetical protein
MTIPAEILSLVRQLNDELDLIEQQANEGLILANQLLERFPDNARLISLFASISNVLFFVNIFRHRIESLIGRISGETVSTETILKTGEELSEIWGRILECKMSVNRSVSILENLQ